MYSSPGTKPMMSRRAPSQHSNTVHETRLIAIVISVCALLVAVLSGYLLSSELNELRAENADVQVHLRSRERQRDRAGYSFFPHVDPSHILSLCILLVCVCVCVCFFCMPRRNSGKASSCLSNNKWRMQRWVLEGSECCVARTGCCLACGDGVLKCFASLFLSLSLTLLNSPPPVATSWPSTAACRRSPSA
jgi:hypothetical protein